MVLIGLELVFGCLENGEAQEAASASGGSGAGDIVPASYQGSGSFFNRKLGTVFRFSYHNRGYGTKEGVATLGSMKVFNLEGATFFLDGQATLSEGFGGGFNTGIGYRELVDTGLSFDPQRIHGISFWTDGQSTSADNFFTQLGFNLESLGESFDARFGGYFPLDRTQAGDTKLTALNTPMFLRNNLVSDALVRSVDTAHSVIDGELAKRIGNLEAWAFLGGYQIGGGGINATGYRVGVRGYAMPDLLLSLQVTDDDIYHTNVVFGLTWFIGRTRRHNQPTGTLLDRLRAPVQRNDFIATTQVSEVVAGGAPLQDATTRQDLRFVHIDSSAAAGGDGTFEKPLTSFANVPATSQNNDTVLVHVGSAVAGQYALKDGQRVIGEGGNIVHTANTFELGVINLPETTLGALAGTVPVITGTGDVFTLANNNEINNFTINGGTRTVVADDVNAPTLRNLVINNPTTNAIAMINITGASSNSNLTITTTSGAGFLVGGAGTIDATGTNTISTTTGVGLDIRNAAIDAADFKFDSVNVANGGATGINLDTLSGTGQVIIGSGTNAGDGGTLSVSGTAIQVNNANQVTFSNVTVNNTAAGSDGVVLAMSAGNKAFFSGLRVTTEDLGFSSTGAGELSVTATNTIATQTGSALVIHDNLVNTAGVTFDSVSTAAGTGIGIDLQNLTGGTVTIGPNTGVDGAGGTLVTAGTAISVSNVEKAVFNDVTATSSAADTATVSHSSATNSNVRFDNLTATSTNNAGVVVTAAGAGSLDVTLRNSSVGSSGTQKSVSLATSAGSGRVDFTLQNNTITAANSNAFSATLAGGSGDVRFLLDSSNSFTNNSATADTLDVRVTTSLELNATITGNTFTNSNAGGTAFNMVLNDPADAGMLDLKLTGNTASDGVGNFYNLNNMDTAGSFRVVDGANATANNTGTVNYSPNIGAFDVTILDADVALPD